MIFLRLVDLGTFVIAGALKRQAPAVRRAVLPIAAWETSYQLDCRATGPQYAHDEHRFYDR
jgi:hypothetical protein